MSAVQGDFPLELLFREKRVYINFAQNPAISIEFKDGKFFQFVYTEEEIEHEEFEGNPMEQKEITFLEFIEQIKLEIKSSSNRKE